jgi:hypothetical protein
MPDPVQAVNKDSACEYIFEDFIGFLTFAWFSISIRAFAYFSKSRIANLSFTGGSKVRY